MRTEFTDAQRSDPAVALSEPILRKCVHCGFCTATCPTYVLLGDELDSPRGRIYLIKDMLEQRRPATGEIVRHVDRCLSCLGCVTTCPSGVDYRRLIDHARVHIERTYRRPWRDRVVRTLLAWLMPHPGRFRAALAVGRLGRPFRRLLPARLRAMLDLVPRAGVRPRRAARPGIAGATEDANTDESAAPAGIAGTNGATSAGIAAANTADGVVRTPGPHVAAESPAPIERVAVLTGCVQAVVGQAINAATVRILERTGVEVVTVGGCCGSVVHHLGHERQSVALAGNLIDALAAEIDERGLDAIVSNASGCGAQLKDFGFVLRNDPERAERAAAIATLVRDVTELLDEIGLPPRSAAFESRPAPRVAYHAACSLQHGQRLYEPPRRLLGQAGFDVVEIAEGHLCCGSAGTYNMLQPAISARLAERKLERIRETGATLVAAGNLGCLTQLATRSGPADRAAGSPGFAHTVELLDWATGGPEPLASIRQRY